jgi:uncharacterized membrane protein YeaQ/YmgE (transglycosylase-associated protein family)
MHILLFLLFGLVVGVLARLIVPGREWGGWAVSILLGVGGSLLGGFFGRIVGLYREAQPADFVMSLLSAIALIGVYHAIATGRRLSRG